ERQHYVASPAAAIFATVQSQADSAVALRSRQLAFDAYITFEQVETEVRARNSALASDLEDAFAALRARAAGGAGHEELDAIHARLLSGLERAERLVADRGSAANLFMESFVLLLREGFEAILLVAALMTFLAKAGAVERRRHVAQGAWAAVGASVITAVVIELLFQITPGEREALGGGGGGTTAVLGGVFVGAAALVLVYIGINRFGLKVPLKPFFAITSAMLYYMAFVFAGKGIADLQEAGLVKTTVLEWAPRIPVLGIYPTLQSLSLQFLLLALLLVAIVWLQRQRLTDGGERRRPSFP